MKTKIRRGAVERYLRDCNIYSALLARARPETIAARYKVSITSIRRVAKSGSSLGVDAGVLLSFLTHHRTDTGYQFTSVDGQWIHVSYAIGNVYVATSCFGNGSFIAQMIAEQLPVEADMLDVLRWGFDREACFREDRPGHSGAPLT